MKIFPRKSLRAITLIEVLVGMVVLAVLASLAIPSGGCGLVHGTMTQTLNNARQLQLATMTMSLDSVAEGKGPTWAYDEKTGRSYTLEEFNSHLVSGNYVQSNDLAKLTNAVPEQGFWNKFSKTTPAFNIYPVSETDATNTVFLATRNWTPYQPLDKNAKPYGEKGFIVMRKGGDGAIYQAKQATNSNAVGLITTNAGGIPLS